MLRIAAQMLIATASYCWMKRSNCWFAHKMYTCTERSHLRREQTGCAYRCSPDSCCLTRSAWTGRSLRWRRSSSTPGMRVSQGCKKRLERRVKHTTRLLMFAANQRTSPTRPAAVHVHAILSSANATKEQPWGMFQQRSRPRLLSTIRCQDLWERMRLILLHQQLALCSSYYMLQFHSSCCHCCSDMPSPDQPITLHGPHTP